MANPNPHQSKAHAEALELARGISDHLAAEDAAPTAKSGSTARRSPAASEEGTSRSTGKTYLPRKFKIVVAVPPSNDVDMFAHDLGFIADHRRTRAVAGWNVTVGGGMGMTHGEAGHLSAPGRRDGLRALPEQRSRRGRSRAHGAARLGRPHRPQACAPEVHDRGSRPRAIPGRGRTARRHDAPATPRAGSTFTTGDRYGWTRATTATGTSRCSSRTAASRTARAAAMLTGLRRIAEVHKGEFRADGEPERHHRERPGRRQTQAIDAPRRRARPRPGDRLGAAPQRAWPAWRCRPAASRWPRANAICRV